MEQNRFITTMYCLIMQTVHKISLGETQTRDMIRSATMNSHVAVCKYSHLHLYLTYTNLSAPIYVVCHVLLHIPG